MRIPRKLKIGGHIYKIKVLKKWENMDEGDFGETDYEQGIIYINKSLTEGERGAAFFHEIFHVLNKTLNHTLLDSLSEQLFQVFKDNKLLK